MTVHLRYNNQAEIEMLWEKLAEGGNHQQCGWLVDKFGVSRQIAPAIVVEMMRNSDPEKAQRIIAAAMEMEKYGIETLKRAYEGRPAIPA